MSQAADGGFMQVAMGLDKPTNLLTGEVIPLERAERGATPGEPAPTTEEK